MKKFMTAVATVALLAGIGMAGANAATRLTDSQLDQVTAGGGFVLQLQTQAAASGLSASEDGGWAGSTSTGTSYIATPISVTFYSTANNNSTAFGPEDNFVKSAVSTSAIGVLSTCGCSLP